ncbi:MAG: hypothetical protein ACK4PI_04090 [Tepidisphaerales bacterium]
MTKRQLIDDIRQYNTTAAPQFLAQFDENALQQYLAHLTAARQKHLRVGQSPRPAAAPLRVPANPPASPAPLSPAAA